MCPPTAERIVVKEADGVNECCDEYDCSKWKYLFGLVSSFFNIKFAIGQLHTTFEHILYNFTLVLFLTDKKVDSKLTRSLQC